MAEHDQLDTVPSQPGLAQEPMKAALEITRQPLSTLCQQCQSIFSRSWEWYEVDPPARETATELEDEDEDPWPCGCTFDTHNLPQYRFSDEPRAFYSHHPSETSMQKAVDMGCEICIQLQYQMLNRDPLISPSVDRTCFAVSESQSRLTEVHKLRVFSSKLGGLGYHEFVIYAQDWKWDAAFSALASLTTGSLETLNLAKVWFEECLESHPSCPNMREPRSYPTRLLTLDGTLVKLLKCDWDMPRGPYATLSHCWGGENFTVLERGNYAQFRAGVELSKFPSTFRDAFRVVSLLSIAYIWIDCFCIIQQDRDWEREAPLMHDVYTNAILNIGASRASKPSDGCISLRSAPPTPTMCVEWSLETSERVGNFILSDWIPAREQLLEEPIFDRAWIVQERLLASRMLHFGSGIVAWECPHMVCVDELAPTYVDVESFSGRTNRYVRHGPGLLTQRTLDPVDLPKGLLSGVEHIWGYIFKTYTRARLTVPTDKAVAIQSLAERVASMVSRSYIGGFSIETLPDSLCWTRADEALQPAAWRAPSWSWLSVDGPLRTDWIDTDNPGLLFRRQLAAVIWRGEGNDLLLLGRSWRRPHPDWDDAVYGWRRFILFLDRDEPRIPPSEMICLPIYDGYDKEYCRFVGLVVVQRSDGAYSRVGVFELSDVVNCRPVYAMHNQAKARLFRLV